MWEAIAVARDAPPQWLALIGIDPLTRRYRCRRTQAAREGQDVGQEAVSLPNRPPGCRLGPGMAVQG